ncbi:hypothetical protein [Streptomyces microflavus]|uniref:hypothetical protein n=1 Tax=Streptomyces microflavus TaxID=1919 RepID=UPI0033A12E6F
MSDRYTEVIMGGAEEKATLASVYSQGTEPVLVSVSDNGRDEAWGIGTALFVVPAIPPDASPTLEYALRVRREASFTGRCSECNATVGMRTFASASGIGVSASELPHRNNCSASDENVGPQLSRHYEKSSRQTVEQKVKASSIKARQRTESIPHENRVAIRNPEFKKWAITFLDEMLSPQSREMCGHLEANVAQAWNIITADKVWRCDECHAYYQESIKKGEVELSIREEFTCDFCDKFSAPIEPLVIRIDNFVMSGGFCTGCAKAAQRAPQTRKVKSRGKNRRKRR